MIYIIYGNNSYLIDSKINEIINQNKDGDVIKVDGSSKNFSYYDVLDSINSVGLFNNKSLVLFKDPPLLKKKVDDKGVDELLSYCKKPIYENTLIFYTYDNDFKKVLKAFKDISSNADVYDLKVDPKNFYNMCIEVAKKYTVRLNRLCFDIVYKACNNSLSLFKQNMDILDLYPEKIDEDVVNNLLISSNEENVFNLINALTNKKVSDSIYYARRILANDSNINGLIALLANQLRFLYQVSYYSDDPYGASDILGCKSPYRITKALETLRTLKSKDIMSMLDRLAVLDLDSKQNSDIDDTLKLELFIVELLK